jgi:type II secretory pathway component PulF
MGDAPNATTFRMSAALIAILLIALAWMARGHRQSAAGRDEVASFTRRFAQEITSGRSLVSSLNDEIGSQPDPRFRTALQGVETEVEKGSALSRAMAQHPEFFDARYVAAVRQGEKSGTLEVALQQLSNSGSSQ